MATLKLSQFLTIGEALSRVNPDGLSGKAIYAIARNINKLEPEIKAYQKSRDELIKSISGGLNVIDQNDKEKIELFTNKVEEMLGSNIDVEFHKFLVTDDQLAGTFKPNILAILLESGIVTVEESPTPVPVAA